MSSQRKELYQMLQVIYNITFNLNPGQIIRQLRILCRVTYTDQYYSRLLTSEHLTVAQFNNNTRGCPRTGCIIQQALDKRFPINVY